MTMAILNIFGGIFSILLIVALSLLLTVFWILMLIDVAKREFKESSERVLWILGMVFFGIIVTLIYYFVVYKKDKSKNNLNWMWITMLILFLLIILSVFLFL